ncbi:Acetyltransferase (GNAT) family protein [Nonomuraea maritima]|uniref:Acetyltransferase (GNAT) family protein n=1 Tax=Nonomuraea maritima TaxID=683260 RepID=A0A1G9M6H0_9ACTN|nr:GNAT family N-acetyltransferase [Nonomuraea maritima]SDL69860.1 Acetyltransferase (GNAT) family protein [Nonomuraea maritima]
MIEFRGAGPAEFADRLEAVIGIYAAAMRPPTDQIAGRMSIMRTHGTYPYFQCYFAELRHSSSEPDIVGFAYGFRGEPGQWWHDVVHRGLADKMGGEAADAWMGHAFELAEIHVHPDHQGKGIGRAMIRTLCAGRRERSAVLSTHDRPTAARHLYADMGFTDLLPRFVFPGGREEYVIAGRPLPLP